MTDLQDCLRPYLERLAYISPWPHHTPHRTVETTSRPHPRGPWWGRKRAGHPGWGRGARVQQFHHPDQWGWGSEPLTLSRARQSPLPLPGGSRGRDRLRRSPMLPVKMTDKILPHSAGLEAFGALFPLPPPVVRQAPKLYLPWAQSQAWSSRRAGEVPHANEWLGLPGNVCVHACMCVILIAHLNLPFPTMSCLSCCTRKSHPLCLQVGARGA